MKQRKRLFLLDGMALVYRAHFAFVRNPIFTSKGLNTSTHYGYTNTLLNIISSETPSHIAVAFDTSEPTFRHKEYPEYKAQREEMPEDLSIALPHIFQLTEAFNIPIITAPGYEADDIIGTIAKRAEKEDFETYMVTPDKDFAQLVSEKTFLHKPARMGESVELMGVPEVLKKWGIERVEQVIDVLGLWGDSSDNIPGIPGIGQKTAQKLLAKYGSIESLIEHCQELKGKQKENVETFSEQALLSKRLATINCNTPVEIDLESMALKEPDMDRLRELFNEFEFRSLSKRVFGKAAKKEESPTPLFDIKNISASDNSKDEMPKGVSKQETLFKDLKTIAEVRHDYRLLKTSDERAQLIEELNRSKSFCFDTETTGLNPKTARLIGLAISITPHSGYYVACPPNEPETQAILEAFRPVFEDPDIEKTGHHLKYDLGVLNRYGIAVHGKLFDTMLAHYLLEPEMRHGMDYLSETYLDYSPISIKTLIGEKKDEQLSMRDIPLEQVKEYAAEDADITLQLKQIFETELKEKGREKVFNKVECPLIPVLVSMEAEGIAIDTEALKEISIQLSEEIIDLKTKIFEAAGSEFNLNSPKQLGKVLFDDLKLDTKAKKTKTGQYATNEQVLTRLAPKHEIVQNILDYRMCAKLKSTYVDTLPSAVSEETGRVHTTYNQAVTTTGRMQSQNPNLQNIPIRTARGREIRKAFIPRNDDYVLLSADYSQIELRIIAELSQDEGMLEAFIQGVDIHGATAAKVYGVTLEEVTKEMRRKAKMVNFGIIYGISAFGLSQRLGIPRKEASEIIDQYFIQYPNIKEYMNKTIEFARENGYVETLLGRRRFLRDINSRNATIRGAAERNAINSPIQGTAADMIKIAMSNVYNELSKQNLKTKMLLQVHDELVFDLHKEEQKEVQTLVESKMKNAIPMKVPIVVEMGIGKNWLEAH